MICLSFTRYPAAGRVIVVCHAIVCNEYGARGTQKYFLPTSNPMNCASVYLQCAYELYVYEVINRVLYRHKYWLILLLLWLKLTIPRWSPDAYFSRINRQIITHILPERNTHLVEQDESGVSAHVRPGKKRSRTVLCASGKQNAPGITSGIVVLNTTLEAVNICIGLLSTSKLPRQCILLVTAIDQYPHLVYPNICIR